MEQVQIDAAGLSWRIERFSRHHMRVLGWTTAVVGVPAAAIGIFLLIPVDLGSDPFASVMELTFTAMVVFPLGAMLALPVLMRRHWILVQADRAGLSLRWAWPWRQRRWTWDQVDVVWSQGEILIVAQGERYRIARPRVAWEEGRDAVEWLQAAADRGAAPSPPAQEPPAGIRALQRRSQAQ